jgi:hypothetical protein
MLNSECNRFISAGQETPRLLWNTNIHYAVDNIPLVKPTMAQKNVVYSQSLLPSNSFYCFSLIYV